MEPRDTEMIKSLFSLQIQNKTEKGLNPPEYTLTISDLWFLTPFHIAFCVCVFLSWIGII